MAKTPNYLAAVPVDTTGKPIPWSTFSRISTFQTQDATSGTTVKSPLSLTTSPTTITVPQDETTVVIYNTGGRIILISEAADMSRTFEIGVGLTNSFDCAKMSTFYLAAKSSTSVAQFFFQSI